MENQTIKTQSTWYQHGWAMARHMEYGTKEQKDYATSQYEALSPLQYDANPTVAANCSNFIAGWAAAMMD